MAAALKAPPYTSLDDGFCFRAICRRQAIPVTMEVSATAKPKWREMKYVIRVKWPNVALCYRPATRLSYRVDQGEPKSSVASRG